MAKLCFKGAAKPTSAPRAVMAGWLTNAHLRPQTAFRPVASKTGAWNHAVYRLTRAASIKANLSEVASSTNVATRGIAG